MSKPKSLRTVVEQDMTRHTLGHIFAKLNGQRVSRTTFVVVEGGDDLAFYGRFFDRRVVSAYYSTKEKDDGTIDTGGCEELQHIVKTVLEDGRTDKVIGIMDTDYRRYVKGYTYPQNIFNTDCRDMEMTALGTSSVKHALTGWILDYSNLLRTIEPVLRHAGLLRVLNEKYRLGCNFDKKCKIDKTFDEHSHTLYTDWKKRYLKAFLKASLLNKRKNTSQRIKTSIGLCKATLHCLLHSYKKERTVDLLQGHDTIHLMSLCTAKTSTYSEQAIWEKCFDAYTPADFARTRLFAAINAWQVGMGLSIFKQAVA